MNFIQKLIAGHREAKTKKLNVQEFKTALLSAISDGKLTAEEIGQLNQMKTEYGLTDADCKTIRAEAYAAAFAAAKTDQKITHDEEAELANIQKFLGLADADIEGSRKELARMRLLAEIQQGNVPTINVANIITKKHEKVYWSEPSNLIDDKVVKRRYEGGSRGVSIRIMKGVSYRVGAHRGELICDTDFVSVSSGELIITSHRVILRGDKKSFVVMLDKILDVQLASDGIRFSESNKAKPRIVKFNDKGNQEIVGAVLSHAINNFA